MGADEERLSTESFRSTAMQELPAAPAYHNWTASVQAYYGGGASLPPYFTSSAVSSVPHPYLWGGQRPMVSPYGTPLPYPTLYPRGALYAHSDVAMAQHVALTNTAIEGKASDEKHQISMDEIKRTSGNAVLEGGKCGESGKLASGSENADASQSDESACASSSEASDENANQEASSVNKKRSFNQLLDYEASASSNNAAQHNNENPLVSLPGKLALSMTHLNIERSSASGGRQQLAPTAVDEREIKREKRKQSNRESARRSRLRKLAECDELQVKVDLLNDETRALREELRTLAEECEKVTSENNSIMEELTHLRGTSATPSLVVSNHNAALCSVNGEDYGRGQEDTSTENKSSSWLGQNGHLITQ